ncbi:hypothetical protein V8G54_006651 [Vigna mungo]|uniref:DUF4283 domain-containing protein n=1 Tax=Vigna mungo TaxID=3915 RepID=A0AAQ3S4R9_VIGMU
MSIGKALPIESYIFTGLRMKLEVLQAKIKNCLMILLGNRFCELVFTSQDDLRAILATGSWKFATRNLEDAFMDLTLEHKNILYDLPQEYWRPKILFSLASGVGKLLQVVLAILLELLVDIDLLEQLPEQLLVEREDYVFFVSIMFKRLPEFCHSCHIIIPEKFEMVLIKQVFIRASACLQWKMSVEYSVELGIGLISLDHSLAISDHENIVGQPQEHRDQRNIADQEMAYSFAILEQDNIDAQEQSDVLSNCSNLPTLLDIKEDISKDVFLYAEAKFIDGLTIKRGCF